MANSTLFPSYSGALLPQTDTVNSAGGAAYALAPQQALAQYAITGCLTKTFYTTAQSQLTEILKLSAQVTPEFLAKTAIYCRTEGYMKDTPALLCAILASRNVSLLTRIFDRVIDDGKMLRNFVQILRSGVVGRKSLGSAPKHLVQNWFARRSDDQILRASVGQSPSLADIVKMVHPHPATASREALYAWMIGRPVNNDALPALVRHFENFKLGFTPLVPDVPFQMLTALNLKPKQWKAIAAQASWQTTRMNLNTFARHEVFEDRVLTRQVAARLRDREKIQRARCFPYQLLMAYSQADRAVPAIVREALQDAMEIATENVPRIVGKVIICPDVSGSMHSPVTGHRSGATSVVRCLDVAALIAATILRRNAEAEVLPFESVVRPVRLNPRDTVFTNAQKLAALPSGGTNCSAPLRHLNQKKIHADLVIYVSDNESWMDTPTHGRCGGSRTETMSEWSRFKERNATARLVCLDLQPNATTQAAERNDILNIGGFSDAVFELVSTFAKGELNASHWVGRIEKIDL